MNCSLSRFVLENYEKGRENKFTHRHLLAIRDDKNCTVGQVCFVNYNANVWPALISLYLWIYICSSE